MSAVFIFRFFVIKALDRDWIRIGIQPKMLDQDSIGTLYRMVWSKHIWARYAMELEYGMCMTVGIVIVQGPQ
jgi:hypothetical protein